MSNSVTDSRFNMWRCMVALAHTDGQVDNQEIQHLTDYFNKLPFTDEQRASLETDLATAQNPEELFQKLTEPQDRGLLIYYGRLLFHSDGDFHQQEEALHKRLTEKVMSRLDLTDIMHQADKAVELSLSQKRSPGLRGAVEALLERLSI